MGLSARQMEMRRTGVGASEAPAVLGLSPWEDHSLFSIWKSKVMGDEKPTTPAMRFGSAVEAGIIEIYCEDTKARVIKSQTRRHPKHKFLLATPDRIVLEADKPARLVQAKSIGSRTESHWGTDGPDAIPAYVLAQVMVEMEVVGLDTCDVAALFLGSRDFRIYTVHREERLVTPIVEIIGEFWRRYVVPGQVPPMDMSDAAARYLREKYPMPKRADLAPPPPEAEALAREYVAARDAVTAAEEQKELLKRKLCDLIGEDTGFENEALKCTWKPDERGKTNWKAVAAELNAPPDLAEKHRGTPERKLVCNLKTAKSK